MSFLPPNQQRQSTEGFIKAGNKKIIKKSNHAQT